MTALVIALVVFVIVLVVVGAVVALLVGGPGGDAVELVVDAFRRLTGRGRAKQPPGPRIDDRPPAPGEVRWPTRGQATMWCPTCGAPVDVRAPACPRCGRPAGR